MKFNLKNRPDERKWFYRRQVKDWFEGFEKELREILEAKYPHEYWHAILKEILGE